MKIFVVNNECPVCGSGPIGLITVIKDGAVLPACWECQSLWPYIEDIKNSEPLPDLNDRKVRWASQEDIDRVGLNDVVIDTNERTDNSSLFN